MLSLIRRFYYVVALAAMTALAALGDRKFLLSAAIMLVVAIIAALSEVYADYRKRN